MLSSHLTAKNDTTRVSHNYYCALLKRTSFVVRLITAVTQKHDHYYTKTLGTMHAQNHGFDIGYLSVYLSILLRSLAPPAPESVDLHYKACK